MWGGLWGGGKGGISGQSVEPRGQGKDRIGIFKDEMFLDYYHRIYQYPLNILRKNVAKNIAIISFLHELPDLVNIDSYQL